MSGAAPTDAEIRAALVDAEECLRWAASNLQIPSTARVKLRLCADRAQGVVARMPPADGAA